MNYTRNTLKNDMRGTSLLFFSVDHRTEISELLRIMLYSVFFVKKLIIMHVIACQ